MRSGRSAYSKSASVQLLSSHVQAARQWRGGTSTPACRQEGSLALQCSQPCAAQQGLHQRSQLPTVALASPGHQEPWIPQARLNDVIVVRHRKPLLLGMQSACPQWQYCIAAEAHRSAAGPASSPSKQSQQLRCTTSCPGISLQGCRGSRRLTVTLGRVVVPRHKECLPPIASRGVVNVANNPRLLAPCEGVYFADRDCCHAAADVKHCKVQVLATCRQPSQPSRPAAGGAETSCSSVQPTGQQASLARLTVHREHALGRPCVVQTLTLRQQALGQQVPLALLGLSSTLKGCPHHASAAIALLKAAVDLRSRSMLATAAVSGHLAVFQKASNVVWLSHQCSAAGRDPTCSSRRLI